MGVIAGMAAKRYISDYFQQAADNLGDKEFLVCQDKTLSWAEAFELSTLVSAFVSAKLAGRQQKIIGLLLPDSWQFAVSYFGIVSSGNIAMPLDVTFKKLEIDFVVGAVKPDFVVVDRQSRHLIDGPAVLVEDILLQNSAAKPADYQLPPDKQIATLFFSSGTTGKPKPIPNTHSNQIWDIGAIAGPMGWTGQDKLLINLHLAHRHGLVICLFGAIFHGNSVYLEERFNAKRTLEMLTSGKISLYSSVPAAYAQLVAHDPQSKFDLSAVRLFASSSSALSPGLYSAFKDRFGHSIVDRYGTSETGSIAIKPDSSDESFGEILKEVEIRLEKNGEIALKSPGLFPGYYRNEEATRANLTADGWWLTGDIGEMRQGRLGLKGRTKEKISKAGYSVFPQDIEWALAQAPDVGEVKVTGIPIMTDGINSEDKIIAFLTGSADIGGLEEYARLNLPRSWRPDNYIRLEEIPKTANGKPRLTELRKLAEQAA